VTRVDYDRGLWRAYRAGRALTVLDLGAGTGRFAVLLADAFDARVVAVEPSEKMRVEAERHSAHPRVFSGRLDGVPHYAFFPSARAVDEARLPTLEAVRQATTSESSSEPCRRSS